MTQPHIEELLSTIIETDDRYTAEAYLFVRQALDYTVHKLNAPRHISGQELLDGIRVFALKEFGPITKRVLSEWGIHECVDFGHIVFNLVEGGLLGKTDEDSIEDFSKGYDFDTAFLKPYAPASPKK